MLSIFRMTSFCRCRSRLILKLLPAPLPLTISLSYLLPILYRYRLYMIPIKTSSVTFIRCVIPLSYWLFPVSPKSMPSLFFLWAADSTPAWTQDAWITSSPIINFSIVTIRPALLILVPRIVVHFQRLHLAMFFFVFRLGTVLFYSRYETVFMPLRHPSILSRLALLLKTVSLLRLFLKVPRRYPTLCQILNYLALLSWQL